MNTILECVNLSKSFGGVKAVNNVNLKIHTGSITGIIGPNGAGKTTLFNLFTGVTLATSGEVLLNEKDITKMTSDNIAKLGMARTFQNIKLFRDLSVLENVKLGFHTHLNTNIIDATFKTKRYKADEEFAREEGLKLLDKVGMLEYANQSAGNLAYGSQRKLEIARALALKPKILLLDEPAAGMNPSETEELGNLIRSLNDEGITMVVIEHDMKFVMNLCHEIIVINFGGKISEGTPIEVTNNPDVRKAYLGEKKQKYIKEVM